MATVLTRANITEARAAVDAYEATCNSIYQSFQGTLTTLTTTNWIGDGSEGCKYFFNNTSTPALTEGVASLTKAVRDILTNIEQATLDNMDPQIGEANRSTGAAPQ